MGVALITCGHGHIASLDSFAEMGMSSNYDSRVMSSWGHVASIGMKITHMETLKDMGFFFSFVPTVAAVISSHFPHNRNYYPVSSMFPTLMLIHAKIRLSVA